MIRDRKQNKRVAPSIPQPLMYRNLRKLVIGFWVAACLANIPAVGQTTKPTTAVDQHNYALTKDDDAFLEDLEHRAFLFFWEHSDPKTGLTLDRARTSGDAPPPGESHYQIASIASTGFALTGYCIAAKR